MYCIVRSNGQRSGLEVGGGILCRPNPVATLLVMVVHTLEQLTNIKNLKHKIQ